LSQLELACAAEISARHLCFLENGRSQPSREMLLRLAEHLQVPIRERNLLLNSAGYAPIFPERPLADPELDLARKAIDLILAGHKPYPAFAVDRHWTLVASNDGFAPFLQGINTALLQPPVNVLRFTLHPEGLGPRLANYQEWRAHVIDKLREQCRASADPVLAALLSELSRYPVPRSVAAASPLPVDPACHRFVVPFQLITDRGILSFFSTTTVFGTPVDITLAELSIESFYPADPATAAVLHSVAAETQREVAPV
jgi:transcriptional regulator with XRE-family HTH domain